MVKFLLLCALAALALKPSQVLAGLLPPGASSIDLSLSFTHLDDQQWDVPAFALLVLEPDQLVLVPLGEDERLVSTELLSTALTLRVGAAKRLEPYLRLERTQQWQRLAGPQDSVSQSRQVRQSVWAGMTLEVKPESDWPGLLVYGEQLMHSRSGGLVAAMDGWALGVTAYGTYDPVLLSLSLSHRAARTEAGAQADPVRGHGWALQPSMSMALNPRMALSLAARWHRKTQMQSQTGQSFWRSGTDLSVGFGYSPSAVTTLEFSLTLNASGRNRADLGLTLARMF